MDVHHSNRINDPEFTCDIAVNFKNNGPGRATHHIRGGSMTSLTTGREITWSMQLEEGLLMLSYTNNLDMPVEGVDVLHVARMLHLTVVDECSPLLSQTTAMRTFEVN